MQIKQEIVLRLFSQERKLGLLYWAETFTSQMESTDKRAENLSSSEKMAGLAKE